MADPGKPRNTKFRQAWLLHFPENRANVCPMQPKDAWLSVGEAAQLVGVSVDTIKRWEKAGRITSTRTPTNHRRFRREDVEALLAPSSQVEPVGTAS